MSLNLSSSVAELRNEIERKRNKALELQMDTTNPDEWSGLNTIRWELEDLDKDIYLGQFIKNNDALSKLIDKIKDANQDAAKLINTIQNVEDAVKDLRDKIDQASPLISEISGFLVEVEKTMVLIKDGA